MRQRRGSHSSTSLRRSPGLVRGRRRPQKDSLCDLLLFKAMPASDDSASTQATPSEAGGVPEELTVSTCPPLAFSAQDTVQTEGRVREELRKALNPINKNGQNPQIKYIHASLSNRATS